MKILFVVPYVPDPIRVRPYNLVRFLAERGHDLSLATLWTSEAEKSALSGIEEYCRDLSAFHLPRWRSFANSLMALPTRNPLQSAYCWQPGLAKKLERMACKPGSGAAYDVIHVEHIRGARFGVHLKSSAQGSGSQIPIVWDSVDSIAHLFRQAAEQSEKRLGRWMARFELKRTERYEDRLLDLFDRVLVTSEQDKQAFLSYPSGKSEPDKVAILRNGVDLDYFKPAGGEPREPATLVVSGKMSYHANVTMVLFLLREIMPLVWAARGDTNVWIVGKDPPGVLRMMADDPRITVTGTVADIRPYLQQATLSVAPLTYGAGIQNKVLEAMACETPVVASHQAASALDVKSGEELMIAGEPAEYAGKIIELIENSDLAARIGRTGRSFVEKRHDWGAAASQLEEIYRQAAEK